MRKIFITLFILTFTIMAGGFAAPSPVKAVSNWQEAGSIEPRWNTDFGSDTFKQSVDKLAAIHANEVTLIVPYYQSNIYSTDIQAGWNTPTDDSLGAGIDYIHSKGMKVMLKIHLDPYDGQWRANISPGDRTTWYNNYQNMLNHVATIAQQHHAEVICIGTELIDMASQYVNGDNGQHWAAMADHLRTIYSGQLTYSANWGGGEWNSEEKYINFWDHLDFIGISAYWPVASSDNYSMSDLMNSWSQIDSSQIKPLYDQWHKPIVFTEVGYRSAYGSLANPPIWQNGSSPNMQEQSDGYTALFQYWSAKSYFDGISFWEWSSDPNAGGTGDSGYTPQNKPAQTVISNWFAGGGGGPSPTPPPPATGQFSATAAASPANLSNGQGTTINASVSDNGNAASNLIVDIEAYNQSGQKVFQKFFGGESFSNGQTKTYSAGWTPNASGAYRVTVGVFAGDWSANYYWNNQAASITVGGSGTPTPTPTPTPTNTPTPTPNPTPTPTPGGIDIWWPTNGVHLAGTQPFKAMLKNLDISQYDMYWQVDNGQLNKMYDSQTDWPHKEAMVDLSGWTWEGGHTYHLNFVAKDHNGNVLGQQAVDIYVNS